MDPLLPVCLCLQPNAKTLAHSERNNYIAKYLRHDEPSAASRRGPCTTVQFRSGDKAHPASPDHAIFMGAQRHAQSSSYVAPDLAGWRGGHCSFKSWVRPSTALGGNDNALRNRAAAGRSRSGYRRARRSLLTAPHVHRRSASDLSPWATARELVSAPGPASVRPRTSIKGRSVALYVSSTQ